MRTKVDGLTLLRLIDLIDYSRMTDCLNYMMAEKILVFIPPQVEVEHLYKTFVQNPFNSLTCWNIKNEGAIIEKSYYKGVVTKWEWDFETGGIVISELDGIKTPDFPAQNAYFDITSFKLIEQFM